MIRNGKGKVYMAVTKDKYEFPIIICDTIPELAEKTGVKVNTIAKQCMAQKAGRPCVATKTAYWFRYAEIDLNDDDYSDLQEVSNEEIRAITMDFIDSDYDEYIQFETERLEKQREYNRRKYYLRKERQKAKNKNC